MIMYNGESVFPDNNGVPQLFSIGVGQGRIVRFCGQTRHMYTVLPHTQTVCELVAPQYRIHALFHDAPEVCHSDVPTPWKYGAAKRSEKKLLKRMYNHYGIKWPIPPDAMQAVEAADAAALAAEANVLMHAKRKEIWPVYDEHAARQTRRQLKLVPQYLDPSYSGPLFESLFETYYEQYLNARLIAA